MRQIEIADETFERLTFAARVFKVSVGDVVSRLLHAMDAPEPEQPTVRARAASSSSPEPNEVKIHVVYRGERVSGGFDPATNRVLVTSGLLSGKIYTSPSAAAVGVVESINPGRENPQTNGRLFWIIDDTGMPLRSLLGRR